MKLVWNLPAEAEHVSLCRHLLRTILEHLQIQENEIGDLELALGELCTNVIRHAKMAPGSNYDVEMEVGKDGAVLTVCDRGIGFDSQATLMREMIPTPEGGMGLWLVSQLMDRMVCGRVDEEGTVIRVERRFHARNEDRLVSAG